MRATLLLILAQCLAGCAGGDTGTDTEVDSDTELDSDTEIDSDTEADLDTDADTEPDTDEAVPLDGVGAITGDCGPLSTDDLLGDDALAFFTTIDIPASYDDDQLTVGGMEILDDGNLNASSLYSEIFAYELLARCELATLLLTENEVTYDDPQGKKTDLVVDIDGVRVGVSVVRAVGFPRDAPYTEQQALTILEDKLADVPIAADNADDASEWDRSILHVIAYSPDHMDSIDAALDDVPTMVRGETIVYVTATDGADGFIYGD